MKYNLLNSSSRKEKHLTYFPSANYVQSQMRPNQLGRDQKKRLKTTFSKAVEKKKSPVQESHTLGCKQ